MVPAVGIEPTRTKGPRDFESRASTCFTTPAHIIYNNLNSNNRQDKKSA